MLWYVHVACFLLALNMASWCYFWHVSIFHCLWTWYLLHFCHACLNLLLCDLAIAKCSSFVKHLLMITSICFVAMLEYSSLVSCCMLSSIVLLTAELCHSCFACHLQTMHPFPVIFISISNEIISYFQWHAWFAKLLLVHHFPSGARLCIAYHILHIMPCIASCCLCIAPWLIVVPLLVFCLG